MSAAELAHVGAAALGVSALIALVIFYLSYGLHRPTGPRVRLAAFFLLATTGLGYTLEWWIEAVGTTTTALAFSACLRLALAATLVNFAAALSVEGGHRAPPDPPDLPMN